MIVDASVVLRAFFPDEERAAAQALIGAHASGRLQLVAPTLLEYEIANATLQAVRRGRIGQEEGEAVLAAFGGLAILMEPVGWSQMLPLALRFDRSAYDAAYLALAVKRGEPLVTADRRLYNAVHDALEWVHWIGEMPSLI